MPTVKTTLTTLFLGTAAVTGLSVSSGALSPASAQTVKVDTKIPGVGTLRVELQADDANAQNLPHRATAFAHHLLDTLSSPGFSGMNGLERAYATEVWSFGAYMTKSQILDSAYSYFQEWPNRDLWFEPGSISAHCDSLCYVSAIYGFDVANPIWDLREGGHAWLELTLQPTNGSFVILEEVGEVIEYY